MGFTCQFIKLLIFLGFSCERSSFLWQGHRKLLKKSLYKEVKFWNAFHLNPLVFSWSLAPLYSLFFFFFFFSYLKGLAPRKKIKVKNEWFRSLFIYSKVKSFTKIGLKYESKISFSPTTTTAWYSWLSLSKLTLMLCLVVTCMGPFSTSPILSISCKSQSHSRLELLLFTIEHDIWALEFRLHKPPSQKNNKIKISKLTKFFFFFFSSHSLFV